MLGHIAQHHRVRSDSGVIANGHASEDFGPGANIHMASDLRKVIFRSSIADRVEK
jgi:hypothetical protein